MRTNVEIKPKLNWAGLLSTFVRIYIQKHLYTMLPLNTYAGLNSIMISKLLVFVKFI